MARKKYDVRGCTWTILDTTSEAGVAIAISPKDGTPSKLILYTRDIEFLITRHGA